MEEITRRKFVKTIGGIFVATSVCLSGCTKLEIPQKTTEKRKKPSLTKIEQLDDFFSQIYFVQELETASAVKVLSKKQKLDNFICLGQYNCSDLNDIVFSRITSNEDGHLTENTSIKFYSIKRIYEIYGGIDLRDFFIIDDKFYEAFQTPINISDQSINWQNNSAILKRDRILPL